VSGLFHHARTSLGHVGVGNTTIDIQLDNLWKRLLSRGLLTSPMEGPPHFTDSSVPQNADKMADLRRAALLASQR